MTPKLTRPLVTAALALVPAAATAETTQDWRCQSDSLDTTAALERIEWARQCGLIENTGGASSWVPSTRALDGVSVPPSLVWAKEYVEIDHNRAFSGNFNAYNVNFYYSYARYESTPMYTVAKESSGFTIGYWKWSHTLQRVRPMYPTFETSPVAGAGIQLFPGDYITLPPPPPPTCLWMCPLEMVEAYSTSTSTTSVVAIDCTLYTDAAHTTPYSGNFYVVAYCESGCYAPDQSLQFSDGDVNIVDAMKAGRDDVVTLTADATLDDLATQTSRVYSYTTDIREAEHVMYEITTASGGALRVTNEHPMVTSEGRLVKAEKLATGDELLRADGTPDRIEKIAKTTEFGKVYNLKPVSREPVANILIAQGYLVGSGRFQNDDVGYMNRVLLYRGVPDDVLPK